MLGAILKVLRIDTDQDWNDKLESMDIVQDLAMVALEDFHPEYKCLADWNDEPGRTALEAAQLLRQVADHFDEQDRRFYADED